MLQRAAPATNADSLLTRGEWLISLDEILFNSIQTPSIWGAAEEKDASQEAEWRACSSGMAWGSRAEAPPHLSGQLETGLLRADLQRRRMGLKNRAVLCKRTAQNRSHFGRAAGAGLPSTRTQLCLGRLLNKRQRFIFLHRPSHLSKSNRPWRKVWKTQLSQHTLEVPAQWKRARKFQRPGHAASLSKPPPHLPLN